MNYKFTQLHKDALLQRIQKEIEDNFLSVDENGNLVIDLDIYCRDLHTETASIYIGKLKLEVVDGVLKFKGEELQTGPGLTLGETETTAYRGDLGKTAYDHSQDSHAPQDSVTLATVKADSDISDAITKKHDHSNQTELDLITDGDHDARTDNPHSVTKSQVGLGDVANVEQIPLSQKGAASGVATLDADGHIPLDEISLGVIKYMGTWNATTNSPELSDNGVGGINGDYYVVNVAGTTEIDGIDEWEVGDWIVNNGTIWQKVDNTEKVSSVAGKTGVVTLVPDDAGLGNVSNDAQLKIASNLSDVNNRQTALDNLTNVSAATNEYVLTKDTVSGNAIFKVASGGTGSVPTAWGKYF